MFGSVFDKCGELTRYWHIIGISSDFGKNRSKRTYIYDFPLLVWRDAQGTVHAVLDVCAHKRSRVAITDFDKNEITCPYHGWKYDGSGLLVDIPSSPDLDLSKMKCKLHTFQIKEHHGLIWIYLNDDQPPKELPFSLDHESAQQWSQVYLSQNFETTEDLLIENFMDATHTAFIHKGLIRGHGDKAKHQVQLTTNETGLMVNYAETTENIGVALGMILGSNLRVQHSDEFIFPNLVKVTYVINDIIRFTAIISCNATTSGNTEAIVRLSFSFKWLNPIIKRMLPFLAKKVLNQDFDITKRQYDNQQVFTDLKDHPISLDLIYNKVKSLRKAKMDGVTEVKLTENSFDLYL
jgi:nitrite reductase/ring-hydroxylating ferredoxin subunit